ncbi:MAG: PqqD family protein [Deltaproteobacteria bacterium]|nr:PqqD family protein [Deltaproteobacteria bacterium]
MESETKYRRNEEIVFREEDDGAFLFDPDSGDLRYLNQSGKETFLLLGEDQSMSSVIRRMRELYPDIDPQQIEDDVRSFVKDLEENRFILT